MQIFINMLFRPQWYMLSLGLTNICIIRIERNKIRTEGNKENTGIPDLRNQNSEFRSRLGYEYENECSNKNGEEFRFGE